jgi:hypothetical protein
MRELINKNIARYLKFRYYKIQQMLDSPVEIQQRIFRELIRQARNTEWGVKYDFAGIDKWEQFHERVPVSHYDDLKPFIHRMMYGQKDVLWPGQIRWFSKSSGTTADKSKYIPVSMENLKKCHYKSNWDILTILYHQVPDSSMFAGKNLAVGGTVHPFEGFPDTMVGDISGVMIKNSPPIGRTIQTPDMETLLESDWNKKIKRIAERTLKEDVRGFGGVPTWIIVLFRKMMEMTGSSNMLEIWPKAEVYLHGGVSFEPYRESFRRLFPSDQFNYLEVYNASEGFFGAQLHLAEDDMLLLVDNEIFYEFIPFDQFGSDDQPVITLGEVEKDKNYVLLISTNSGLWRYVVGDTVMFTCLDPYKIKITGRIKHFINVFGEEVMVSNTDKAVAETCEKHGVVIHEYTVAPIFLRKGHRGGHQWLVEFNHAPADLDQFTRDLDLSLQQINSDYEAKRFNDLALKQLDLVPLPKGTFYRWMASRGKLGGQNKIPRLSNSRQYVDSILNFFEEQ